MGWGPKSCRSADFIGQNEKISKNQHQKNKHPIKLRFSNWSLQSDNPEKKVIPEKHAFGSYPLLFFGWSISTLRHRVWTFKKVKFSNGWNFQIPYSQCLRYFLGAMGCSGCGPDPSGCILSVFTKMKKSIFLAFFVIFEALRSFAPWDFLTGVVNNT